MGRLKAALVSIYYSKIPDGLRERLEQENVDLVIHNCQTEEELLRYGTDADLLWINSGRCILSKGLLARLPRCSAGIVTLKVLGRKGPPHGFPFRRPHSQFPIH